MPKIVIYLNPRTTVGEAVEILGKIKELVEERYKDDALDVHFEL